MPRGPFERSPAAARATRVAPQRLPGGVRERARKRLVTLVLVIYLLAIFEGSIRKYVVPQFGQYVFFIRDPFLLYAYVLATAYGFWPRNNLFFRISALMCVGGVLLFGLQIAMFGLDETRIVLGIYGWRSYFLYVPLAFVVGEQFNSNDLTKFARLTLALAVPIAVLVVLQFSSPPGATINVGVAEEQELQFKSVGLDVEHIRTNGPFTSPAGQQQFIATAFALALASLLAPKRRLGLVFLAVTASATLTCLALSGSRGAMLQCALGLLFAMGLSLLGKGVALKAKALWLPASLGAAAVALFPIVFPAGFQTFSNRWEGAAAAESNIEGGVFGRALLGLFDFVRLVGDVPTLGYGLGYGGNASLILGAVVDGVKPGVLVEADFSRHMVDLGPALGICYVVFRVAMAIWLTSLVLRATRRTADPMAMLLCSYASYTLVFAQLTGQGTINIFGWLVTGLCIAATRHSLAPFPSGMPATQVPAPGPYRAWRSARPWGRAANSFSNRLLPSSRDTS